jgi:DNA-binding IclR family transcriptional regulator
MVKSAYRVTQILEAVAASRAGLRHADLAAILNIPKGSLSLLLADLVSQDYLALREDGVRRYALGPQILVMAKHYLSGLDLVRLGQPVLKELVVSTSECAEIGIRRGDEILMVCREDCSRPLRSVIQIGDRAPLYATAAGKAVLAHLPLDEIDAYLSKIQLKALTRKTITKRTIIQNELKAIRAGGVAYSREEHNEGVIAIGHPVFDFNGLVAGSIVVPMPTIRFNAKKAQKIEGLLRQACAKVSRNLGYDNGVSASAKKVAMVENRVSGVKNPVLPHGASSKEKASMT